MNESISSSSCHHQSWSDEELQTKVSSACLSDDKC
jgi:hypothetical protein